jgi:hypothetical protein
MLKGFLMLETEPVVGNSVACRDVCEQVFASARQHIHLQHSSSSLTTR